MRKLHLKKWIPELYLMASAVFYWISTSTFLNPVAIILVSVLLALFTWKKKTLGMMISFIFLILSLYMVLALISELREFATFNKDAKIMLGVGVSWLGLNIILAMVMLIKWGSRHSISGATVNTQTA